MGRVNRGTHWVAPDGAHQVICLIFGMVLSFLFSLLIVEVLTSQNVGSYVTGVAFHPTKNLVASCSSDKSVKLWNADTGAELWTVKGHSEDNPECLCEHPSEDNDYEYTANPECPVNTLNGHRYALFLFFEY